MIIGTFFMSKSLDAEGFSVRSMVSSLDLAITYMVQSAQWDATMDTALMAHRVPHV